MSSIVSVPNRLRDSTQVDDEDALIDLFLFCCSTSRNIDFCENRVRISDLSCVNTSSA